MKKNQLISAFIILTALAVSPMATLAQTADTLTIKKPSRVRIITGDSIQKIKVYGREGEPDFRYESRIQMVDSNYVSETVINRNLGFSIGRKSNRHHNVIASHAGVGFCVPAGKSFSGPSAVGSSWELFWTIAQWERFTPSYKNCLAWGVGINWRNYRTDGRSHFVKQTDGTITEQTYPEGYEPEFSRIKVFSLCVPLSWGHRVSKNFSFSLGPVINFNTYASIKSRYHDAEGKKHKDIYKHIHQKPVTVDLMGTLRVKSLPFSIYGKYSPMDMLSDTYGSGVNFQSVSFGVYF